MGNRRKTMTTENGQSVAPLHPIVSTPSLPFAPYYRDDSVTIYNADCRKILPWLGRFDLLLTDPPYGIGIAKKSTVGAANTAKRGSKGTSKMGVKDMPAREWTVSDWDNEPPPKWFLEAAQEIAETSILWGGNYYGLPASSCWLVWDKKNEGTNFADCELAWTNMPKAVRKFAWRWNGMLQEKFGDEKENRVHPTQKPLALMRWCLSLVEDAETVLDPFAGSGTTGVACKLEGRKAVLVEISEEYCEVAAKRLSQGVLF
jgi:DNA modification methylase